MNVLSISFWIILIPIFLLYWLLKDRLKLQNLLLLIVNYTLYSMWDIRFSLLLLAVSVLSYYSSIIIQKSGGVKKKAILYANIILYVGILFVFKYYNFFAKEFAQLFNLTEDKFLINLLLPVGISFYIFTTIAYIIDVYKDKRPAVKGIVEYMSFISFFPLILSGPIERSTTFLPQFFEKRKFSYDLTSEGVLQIVWGLFKKMVIADNCATVVKVVFSNYVDLPASSIIIGAVLYSVQIYCDFSGYSDIAIGTSKLFGFNVRRNFNYPYFSISVSDFWKRWHMSLQKWFVDYIYIPLGGNRCSTQRVILNTFVVFTISGIWHGANWTFIIWGIYHAVLFVPLILWGGDFKKKTINDTKILPSWKELIMMLVTFTLIAIGWVIFNSSSIENAWGLIVSMLDSSILAMPTGIGLGDIKYVLILTVVLFVVEWLGRKHEFPLLFKSPGWLKVVIMYVLIAHIVFCNAAQSDFIYFQF